MKNLLNVASHYRAAKQFYLKYERILMPATLVVGFLVDYFTFSSIEISFTFAILAIYWALAGAVIAFINLYDADKLSQKFRYLRLFCPLLLQFLFGALLSASLIFYWFSGALSVSWPIILIVALLMVFNDVFRHYFLRPTLQISVYFFATFSLISLILPFVFKSLEPVIFLLAGLIALSLAYFFISVLASYAKHIRLQKTRLFLAVFGVLAFMNIFYFLDIIPPIPLAVREAGLYHSIKSSNGKYVMLAEPESFFDSITPGQNLHVSPGEKIYFYTAIFAPADLKTQITHNWQYYDHSKKEWQSKGKMSFSIFGGRREGYKGYSFRSDLIPGDWQIYIENQRGQVLGRMQFMVKGAEGELELVEVIK